MVAAVVVGVLLAAMAVARVVLVVVAILRKRELRERQEHL
jgi:hypothetical protein